VAAAAARYPERERSLRAAGAELDLLPDAPSTPFLQSALERLAARGVASLVVEGGPTLHRAFWDAGLVDRVQMFVTPGVLGSGGVGWLPWPLVSRAHFTESAAAVVGEDVLIEGHVHRID
jgi:diaminohydroxyphosphoribosylaminopyrimidine deaminase/5-amino-6-(5-phosphoribosylamino)uracil reductase